MRGRHARIARGRAVDDRQTAGDRSGTAGVCGFTLIELLVVISVVVLLLAILLPSLQAVRRKTKALVCRSNLRQWGMIWRMYTSDNDGMFHNGDIADYRHLWMEALWPYYDLSRDICLCPMAATPSEVLWKGQNAMGTTFTAWTIFTGNYAWDREGFSGSYGINGWTRNPPEDILAQYQGNFPTANNWRQPDVEGAWQVPLFLDCRWPDGWMSHQYPPPQTEDEPTWARYCINRHDGTVNALFMDCPCPLPNRSCLDAKPSRRILMDRISLLSELCGPDELVGDPDTRHEDDRGEQYHGHEQRRRLGDAIARQQAHQGHLADA